MTVFVLFLTCALCINHSSGEDMAETYNISDLNEASPKESFLTLMSSDLITSSYLVTTEGPVINQSQLTCDWESQNTSHWDNHLQNGVSKCYPLENTSSEESIPTCTTRTVSFTGNPVSKQKISQGNTTHHGNVLFHCPIRGPHQNKVNGSEKQMLSQSDVRYVLVSVSPIPLVKWGNDFLEITKHSTQNFRRDENKNNSYLNSLYEAEPVHNVHQKKDAYGSIDTLQKKLIHDPSYQKIKNTQNENLRKQKINSIDDFISRALLMMTKFYREKQMGNEDIYAGRKIKKSALYPTETSRIRHDYNESFLNSPNDESESIQAINKIYNEIPDLDKTDIDVITNKFPGVSRNHYLLEPKKMPYDYVSNKSPSLALEKERLLRSFMSALTGDELHKKKCNDFKRKLMRDVNLKHNHIGSPMQFKEGYFAFNRDDFDNETLLLEPEKVTKTRSDDITAAGNCGDTIDNTNNIEQSNMHLTFDGIQDELGLINPENEMAKNQKINDLLDELLVMLKERNKNMKRQRQELQASMKSNDYLNAAFHSIYSQETGREDYDKKEHSSNNEGFHYRYFPPMRPQNFNYDPSNTQNLYPQSRLGNRNKKFHLKGYDLPIAEEKDVFKGLSSLRDEGNSENWNLPDYYSVNNLYHRKSRCKKCK